MLDQPERVIPSITDQGRPAIIYERQLDDGFWYYVEEHRVGRRTLALSTFYKRPNRDEKLEEAVARRAGGASERPQSFAGEGRKARGKRPKPRSTRPVENMGAEPGQGQDGEAADSTDDIARYEQALDQSAGKDPRGSIGFLPSGRTLYQSVRTPDWLGDWLGLEGRNLVANADGLFRKYQKRADEGSAPRFASPEAVAAFVEETLENAHIAIEATRDQAVLVARIGEREQAVVIENKGKGGGVVISALEPTPGQLDKKIADVVKDARRRDATPTILVSPLAAADADTRILISRWLPPTSR